MPKCCDCKFEGKFLAFNTGVNMSMVGFESLLKEYGFKINDLTTKAMHCKAPGGGPTSSPIVLFQALTDQPCSYYVPKLVNKVNTVDDHPAKKALNLKCKLGFHSWAGCKCRICEKIRDEQHDWKNGGEKCSICGKIAPFIELEKKGIMLKESGNLLEALKVFKEAILLGSTKSLVYIKNFHEAEKLYNKANDLLRANNIMDAMNDYDKALELYPEYADVWANKGVAFFQLDKKDEAMKCLKKASGLGSSIAKNNLKLLGI